MRTALPVVPSAAGAPTRRCGHAGPQAPSDADPAFAALLAGLVAPGPGAPTPSADVATAPAGGSGSGSGSAAVAAVPGPTTATAAPTSPDAPATSTGTRPVANAPVGVDLVDAVPVDAVPVDAVQVDAVPVDAVPVEASRTADPTTPKTEPGEPTPATAADRASGSSPTPAAGDETSDGLSEEAGGSVERSAAPDPDAADVPALIATPATERPAGAGPLTRTTAPLTAPPVADQLVHLLRPALRGEQGAWSLSLDLLPAHLGEVRVDIQMLAGSIDVRLVSEDAATQEALRSALDDLKAALEDEGLTAGLLQVSDGRTGPESRQDPARTPHAGASSSGPDATPAASPAATVVDPTPPSPRADSPVGLDLRL